ncbi:MAG: hypothetical protein Q9168_001904 [Polycauliona sp. 1 TL-2023]
MTLQSDLTIDASKFRPEAASNEIKQINEFLMDGAKTVPKWYEIGAPKYREMQSKGGSFFPKPIVLDRGQDLLIPSREKGREIYCRVMTPKAGIEPSAVFMHLHGSGFVLASVKEFDTALARKADMANVVVISVGYRKAPEDPFPAGPEDCYDAAEWLVDNSKEKYGATLQFVGGESAGAHLALSTYFHLTTSRPSFRFSGLVLNFGWFDLSLLPSVHNHRTRETLILDKESLDHLVAAFCPGMSLQELRHPSVSPFYQDLKGLDLPPALFMVGTEDCLLDDTVMMAAKWQMHGGQTVVKVFPGAPHGFTFMPWDQCPEAKEGAEVNSTFIKETAK